MAASAIELIRKKRDGGELSFEEIEELVSGLLAGDIPDYQVAAWLMAAVLKGMSFSETLALTDVMVASGERIDLSRLGRTVVDKHSTGGVGDKVTLVLAPLVASCGAVFGKISGRGLGHTGGTVDKLESIPGFRTDLDAAAFRRQLEDIGICVTGQSSELVPADRRLYALRDVTATVESNPLVAASIMCKKIASGTSTVVMDVKMGRGAFFRNRGQAAGAFHLMRRIGTERGVVVKGIISPMDTPLGRAIGNSLEVLEAVEALRGEGPADLMAVVTRLAVIALGSSDLALAEDLAWEEVTRRLADGSALEVFRRWIAAQGGEPDFIEDPSALRAANQVMTVTAGEDGFVASIDALDIGRAALELGAGRIRKGDVIDHAVGVILDVKPGDEVEVGSPVARLHVNDESRAEAAARLVEGAFSYSKETKHSRSAIIDFEP